MSDKSQVLRMFNEAFARGDVATMAEYVTDNIRWSMVGDRLIVGKEAFVEALESMRPAEPMKVRISNIITHGLMAAVNGEMEMKGSGGEARVYAFCDIYKFSGFKNGKISEMTSYGVDVTE